MKTNFNSGDDLPLNKPLKFYNMTITIRSVFEEDGIDVNKTNLSKKYDLCYYWYFQDTGYKYEPYLWLSWFNTKSYEF